MGLKKGRKMGRKRDKRIKQSSGIPGKSKFLKVSFRSKEDNIKVTINFCKHE
jgi:hypothetical protein